MLNRWTCLRLYFNFQISSVKKNCNNFYRLSDCFLPLFRSLHIIFIAHILICLIDDSKLDRGLRFVVIIFPVLISINNLVKWLVCWLYYNCMCLCAYCCYSFWGTNKRLKMCHHHLSLYLCFWNFVVKPNEYIFIVTGCCCICGIWTINKATETNLRNESRNFIRTCRWCWFQAALVCTLGTEKHRNKQGKRTYETRFLLLFLLWLLLLLPTLLFLLLFHRTNTHTCKHAHNFFLSPDTD